MNGITNDLQLTSGGSVDLTGYLDNTDNQNLASVLAIGNSAGSSKIIDLANPTLAQDAATKNYVDSQDTGLQGSINSEITSRTNADASIQSELDASQTGAGLGTDGSYTVDATTTYIAAATSFKNADKLLDTEIVTNASAIGSLSTALSTTYAFEGDFTINETGAVTNKNVSLTDNFDNFNVLSRVEFSAPEDGVYVFIVNAQIPVIDANFRSLVLNINGVSYTLPAMSEYLGNVQFFEKTIIANLTSGQVVKLMVTTVAAMNNSMVGTFSGFKL